MDKKELESRGYRKVSVQESGMATPIEMALVRLRVKLWQRRRSRVWRKRRRNFARMLGAMYKHG